MTSVTVSKTPEMEFSWTGQRISVKVLWPGGKVQWMYFTPETASLMVKSLRGTLKGRPDPKALTSLVLRKLVFTSIIPARTSYLHRTWTDIPRWVASMIQTGNWSLTPRGRAMASNFELILQDRSWHNGRVDV